jgi:hypothetical protein
MAWTLTIGDIKTNWESHWNVEYIVYPVPRAYHRLEIGDQMR